MLRSDVEEIFGYYISAKKQESTDEINRKVKRLNKKIYRLR